MPEPATSAEELAVGELSERSGVPASALRFYERRGPVAGGRHRGRRAQGFTRRPSRPG